MISRAMGNTLQLIIIGAAVSAAIAIGVGVYSSVKQYSKLDYLFTGVSYIGIAMPPFWFGLLLIEFFVVQNRWFLSVGLHTGDSTALQLGLRQASRAADRDPVRADRRVVEPVPAGVDARRRSVPTTYAPRAPRACRDAR